MQKICPLKIASGYINMMPKDQGNVRYEGFCPWNVNQMFGQHYIKEHEELFIPSNSVIYGGDIKTIHSQCVTNIEVGHAF